MLFCPVDWICILPLEKYIMSYIDEWRHRGQGFLCYIGTFLANDTHYISEESKIRTFLFYEDSCFLKCDTVCLGEWFLTSCCTHLRLGWPCRMGSFVLANEGCSVPSECWLLVNWWHTVESQKTWILGEVAVRSSFHNFIVCVHALGNVWHT
jgi:hypothetical protein